MCILPLVKLILTAIFQIRKQHLRPRAVVGYGVKIFGPGLFITSPDHLDVLLVTTSRKHRFRGRLPLGYSSSLANQQQRVSRRILFKLPLCFSRTRESKSSIPAMLQKVDKLKSQVCKNDPRGIRSSAVLSFRQLKLGATKKTY